MASSSSVSKKRSIINGDDDDDVSPSSLHVFTKRNLNKNSIIETKEEELMVSPSTGENLTLKQAFFIKSSIKHSTPPPPLFSISSQTTTNSPLQVKYSGWRIQPKLQPEWNNWVTKLQPKFESLWIKTGIYNAIKASTYEIKRDDDLILQLANRWCSKTNTFVFPWGESTITLEDIKVCFGYSLLGDSISTPLLNSEQEAEAELIEARRMFNKTKAKKVTQSAWMKHFMENESKLEHEAFLVYWLQRFVFPEDSHDTISTTVIPIAILLAHGNRIALAPAVLAGIYRDLTLLNSTIQKSATTPTENSRVTIWAPFQLIQVWALERFRALKPRPCETRDGLPRVARWGGVNVMKNKNLKEDLDCAGFRNGFLWKPYENSPCIDVYDEKDLLKCDNPCLDEFSRCLRVCEFVGMGCKEKYFPHRVAMQFGLDQDIPGKVALCKKDPWINYNKPVSIADKNLFIQLCSRQASVTFRYYDWWKQSISRDEGDNNRIKVEESISGSNQYQGMTEITPSGFTSKFEKNQMEASDKEDHLLVYELSSSDDEVVENRKILSSPEFCDFISSNVGDEAGINSPFCDRDGEKEDSVGPFTEDMKFELENIGFELENRIQNLEGEVAKLKEARFGQKV
ncbi:putative protein-serine/threonine phosphatase [Medicago truncatula]|uniref:Aminotransferase-like plant mobile domain-containing protein n=1 Tax=Medicago truncatula TaxID=3880 RepID=A0A396IP06_MEDTR|nr:putative protein-serine/threonine phosphatase [Medicago truncatula]